MLHTHDYVFELLSSVIDVEQRNRRPVTSGQIHEGVQSGSFRCLQRGFKVVTQGPQLLDGVTLRAQECLESELHCVAVEVVARDEHAAHEEDIGLRVWGQRERTRPHTGANLSSKEGVPSVAL